MSFWVWKISSLFDLPIKNTCCRVRKLWWKINKRTTTITKRDLFAPFAFEAITINPKLLCLAQFRLDEEKKKVIADSEQELDGDPQRHLREGVGRAGHALCSGPPPQSQYKTEIREYQCVTVWMFQAQNNEMLWADLAHKLSDQVVIPLNTYQAQFPEMRVSSVSRWIPPIEKWMTHTYNITRLPWALWWSNRSDEFEDQ